MAALDLPAEYLEAFSTGVVAAGDLVNLSIDLLPAEWVRVHRVPPDAILVGTIVKVGALGSGDDVDVRVDGVANTIKVPVGHASLSHHVRPAAVARFFSSVCSGVYEGLYRAARFSRVPRRDAPVEGNQFVLERAVAYDKKSGVKFSELGWGSFGAKATVLCRVMAVHKTEGYDKVFLQGPEDCSDKLMWNTFYDNAQRRRVSTLYKPTTEKEEEKVLRNNAKFELPEAPDASGLESLHKSMELECITKSLATCKKGVSTAVESSSVRRDYHVCHVGIRCCVVGAGVLPQVSV